MDIRFCFELIGDFKSEDLWAMIGYKGINLLDIIEHVYVHGVATPERFCQTLKICQEFGTIKGGEFYET